VSKARASSAPARSADRVAEANRRYYAATAADYDRCETCLVAPAAQARLADELAELAGWLPPRSHRPLALDACGGTGNASLKLLDLGFDVVNVDVSPAMHALLADKLAARSDGARCRLVETPVDAFLAEDRRRFDVIVFSSALHHLHDYTAVLVAAAERLAPGGWIHTCFDPTARSALPPLERAALRLDYLLYKVFVRFDDLPASALRWLRRRLGRGPDAADPDGAALGALAEFHALRGIDDRVLVAELAAKGVSVARHRRIAHARFAPIRRWLERRGAATEFGLLLQREPGPP